MRTEGVLCDDCYEDPKRAIKHSTHAVRQYYERTAARLLRVFKKEFKAFDCYALDSTVTLPNEQPQKVCSNRIGDKIEE